MYNILQKRLLKTCLTKTITIFGEIVFARGWAKLETKQRNQPLLDALFSAGIIHKSY